MAGNYNLGTASGKIEIDGNPAEKGFQIAQAAAGAFFDAVKGQVEKVRDVGKRLTAVGAAGVAGFGIAVKAASEFASEMSTVKAVSGATEDQFQALRDKALQLGKDTVFSASEAANAMGELVKAGLSVEDVLDGAADATVALAAAGGVSLAEAAAVASNAKNQFNLAASDLPRIADLIAGAANASAIDVSDFAQSLSQAGAVAHLAGLDFDDTAVAIAEMGNAGIKASDAGTSLKTFLSNLIPTTDQQVTLFREMKLLAVDNKNAMGILAKNGIKPLTKSYDDVIAATEVYLEKQGGSKAGSDAAFKAANKYAQGLGVLKNQFFDQNGQVKKLVDIQGLLAKSTSKMTQEQKLAKLEVLFGSDAIRAAAVLADEGAKGYTDLAGAMGKVKAADVAATRLDNLSGSVEQLKGSLETMEITIGEVVMPIVRKFVDLLTILVNAFNNLPPGVQRAIGVVAAILTVLSLVSGAIILVTLALIPMIAQFLAFRALRFVVSLVYQFIRAIVTGTTTTEAFAIAQARAKVAVQRTGFAMKIFAAIVKATAIAMRFLAANALPIAIIIALAVAFYIAYKRSAKFREIVDKVVAALRQGLGVALQYIITQAKALWAVLGPVLGQAFQDIKEVVLSELVPACQDLADSFRSDILPALKQLWSAIQPVLKVLAIAAIVVGVVLYKAFLIFAKFMLGTVIPIAIKFYAAYVSLIIKALALVIVILVKVIAFVIKFVAKFVAAFSDIAAFMVDTYNNLVDWGGKVGKFFKDLGTRVWAIFRKIWSVLRIIIIVALAVMLLPLIIFVAAIITIIKVFGPTIAKLFKKGWDLATKVFQVALGIIIAVVKVYIAIFVTVWRTIFTILAAIALVGWAVLKAIFQVALAIITTVIRGWITILTTIWNAIWPPLHAVLQAFWTGVQAIISVAIAIIMGVINGWIALVRGVWSALWNGLKGPVKAALNGIKALVQTYVDGILAVFDIGQKMYDAGVAIIQKLIDGIDKMLGPLDEIVGKAVGFIGKVIPGSPVKEGPLRVLNKGYAGGQIVKMLADGITKKQGVLERAMAGVTVNGASTLTSLPPGLSAATDRAVPATTQIDPRNYAPLIGHQTVINPIAEPASQTASRESADLAILGKAR